MAKFCTKCGSPLAEGEICKCQQGMEQQNIPQQDTQNGKNANEPQKEIDVFEAIHKISKKIESVLDAIYNFISPAKRSGAFSNLIPVRNLLGFSKEDRLGAMGDCYERGKKIVPELIQPCGQEIPIRQYDICSCRSILRGLWQEGKLQVTNKRVLFRLSGRNWVGKALTSIEFSLDEIAGMDIKTSNKFSFVTFWINWLFAFFFAALGTGLTGLAPKLFAVLGVFIFVAAFVLVRRHYYFKLAVTSFTGCCFIGGMQSWRSEFWGVCAAVALILVFVYLFISSLKPSLDFTVMTKCNSTGPIQIQRVSIWEKFFVWGMEVLPGKDALRAMDEVGTMINDIQKFGDFGIEKWKE